MCVPDPSGDKGNGVRGGKAHGIWHCVPPATLLPTIKSMPRPLVISAWFPICFVALLPEEKSGQWCLSYQSYRFTDCIMLFMASTSGTTWEQVRENFLSQDLNWSCAVIYLIIKIREGNDGPLFVIKHTVLPQGESSTHAHATNNICRFGLFSGLAVYPLFKEGTLLSINHNIRPRRCQCSKHLHWAASSLRDQWHLEHGTSVDTAVEFGGSLERSLV